MTPISTLLGWLLLLLAMVALFVIVFGMKEGKISGDTYTPFVLPGLLLSAGLISFAIGAFA